MVYKLGCKITFSLGTFLLGLLVILTHYYRNKHTYKDNLPNIKNGEICFENKINMAIAVKPTAYFNTLNTWIDLVKNNNTK